MFESEFVAPRTRDLRTFQFHTQVQNSHTGSAALGHFRQEASFSKSITHATRDAVKNSYAGRQANAREEIQRLQKRYNRLSKRETREKRYKDSKAHFVQSSAVLKQPRRTIRVNHAARANAAGPHQRVHVAFCFFLKEQTRRVASPLWEKTRKGAKTDAGQARRGRGAW